MWYELDPKRCHCAPVGRFRRRSVDTVRRWSPRSMLVAFGLCSLFFVVGWSLAARTGGSAPESCTTITSEKEEVLREGEFEWPPLSTRSRTSSQYGGCRACE